MSERDQIDYPFGTEHRPLLIRWDNRHTTPAEVCGTCSDPDTGRWVPVTFCEKARAQMTDEPGSSYADIGGVIRPEDHEALAKISRWVDDGAPWATTRKQ